MQDDARLTFTTVERSRSQFDGPSNDLRMPTWVVDLGRELERSLQALGELDRLAEGIPGCSDVFVDRSKRILVRAVAMTRFPQQVCEPRSNNGDRRPVGCSAPEPEDSGFDVLDRGGVDRSCRLDHRAEGSVAPALARFHDKVVLECSDKGPERIVWTLRALPKVAGNRDHALKVGTLSRRACGLQRLLEVLVSDFVNIVNVPGRCDGSRLRLGGLAPPTPSCHD